MRKIFDSFYPPTNDFFDSLWKDALGVLDANVLLDMYRYSSSTKEDFISLLRKISDRLWLPHQAGLEFSRNRPSVIAEQVQMFNKAKGLLASLRDSTAKETEKILSFRLHPVLNKDEFKKAFEEPVAQLEKKIDEHSKSHPDLFSNDPILDALLDIFEGKIGQPFDPTRLDAIYKEGKARYDKNTPPGYEDARGPNKKEGTAVYGDLVLWFQIVEHAKAAGIPAIIFVSNDMKEDWWWFSKGRNLGCRPELRDELKENSGAAFHMYTSERFLHFAPSRMNFEVKEESIEEVKTLEKENLEATQGETKGLNHSILQGILASHRYNEMLSGMIEPGFATLLRKQMKHNEDWENIIKLNLIENGAISNMLDSIQNANYAKHIQEYLKLSDSVRNFSLPPTLSTLSGFAALSGYPRVTPHSATEESNPVASQSPEDGADDDENSSSDGDNVT